MREVIALMLILSCAGCGPTGTTASAVKSRSVASPASKINPQTVINEKRDTGIEYSESDRIRYNDLEFVNTAGGLTVNKEGRRVLFLKSEHGDIGGPAGKFGFTSLFGNSEKQLVYNTWTGGAHCCNYFWIVDLAPDKPRLIFAGKNYDVQHNIENDDFLGKFDMDGDGVMEITQSQKPVYFDECAEGSQPNISVVFKYDKIARQYAPLREFTPSQIQYVEELKNEVTGMNDRWRANENPEAGSCHYRSAVWCVVLNYVSIGREKEGYEYLKKNYLYFDRAEGGFSFNRAQTKMSAGYDEKRMRAQLKDNGLHKYIYRR